MAFAKQFTSTYYSSANIEYTLDIYVKDYGGSSSEITLGEGGCVISYDTSGSNKFASILSSKMQIPFIVENATQANFITLLRTTYQEQEIYAHLYTSATEPIWSGYVIMDLGSEEDVSYPYEVVLTAVDGIGLLKERDFVQDSATFPYERSETYLADGSATGYKTIIQWLTIILAKTGMAKTDEGAASNYTIQTCVDWYNDEHAAATLAYDPLNLTQCNMENFYKVNDEGEYKPKSSYKVLEEICKAWGMRCVYWHHTFFFIQISLYKTNETGTLSTPVNLPTREYYYTGGHRLNQDYIGTKQYARYELSLENVVPGNGTGLLKLAGSKYDYYPITKQVKANFINANDKNYFQGFPLMNATLVSSAVTPNTWFVTTKSIGIFNNPKDGNGFFCKIPLSFYSSRPPAAVQNFSWTIKAVPVAGGTSKMLSSATGSLAWVTYAAPSDENDLSDGIFNSIAGIDSGQSIRYIFNSADYSGGIIPVDAGMSGDWEFMFEIWTLSGNANPTNASFCAGTGSSWYTTALPSSSFGEVPESTFGYGITNYSNVQVSNISNPFLGVFCAVDAAASVGPTSTTMTATTSTTDSYIEDLGDIMWGDSLVPDSPSSLKVYDGADWKFSSTTGEWGIGVITGTLSFTQLECQEILYNSSKISMKLGGSTALSETNKSESGYIKYVNPIGRIEDLDNRFYAMLRGQLKTGTDEWEASWFEITYNSIGHTTPTQDESGENTGIITGGGNSGGQQGPSFMLAPPYIATVTRTRVSAGTITSINIQDIGETLLKSGDIIRIYDSVQGVNFKFTLSADQTSGDTSLSVVSQSITSPITLGSQITISDSDLFVQYQRKTQGTIAGMPVDADDLGPIGYKGGIYYILGVDTTYIQILPSDFMVNDDVGSATDTPPAVFVDGTNTGVAVEDTDQELIATVKIPYNTTATEVTIWASNTTKDVEVYEMSVNANGKGSTIGTGTTNGSPIDITDTLHDGVNYLMIIVKVSSTNHRVWGGTVTLSQP